MWQGNSKATWQLCIGILNSDGATVSTQGEKLTSGLTVATEPDLGISFPMTAYKWQDAVEDWVNELPPLPEHFALGAWVAPNNDLYLDVVEVLDDKDSVKAIKLGFQNDQLSIYSLTHNQVIWLTYE